MLSYAWEGRNQEACDVARQALQEFGEDDAFAQALGAHGAALADRNDEAERLLAATPSETIVDTDLRVARARTWVLLGRRDAALTEIEQAGDIGLVDFDEILSDPQLSTLLGEPRFERALGARPWIKK